MSVPRALPAFHPPLPAILLFTILQNVCDPDPRRADVRAIRCHVEKERKVRRRSTGLAVEDRTVAVRARGTSDGSNERQLAPTLAVTAG